MRRFFCQALGRRVSVLFLIGFFASALAAQESYQGVTVPRSYPELSETLPSAGSILTPHVSSGRFGPYSSGGFMNPSTDAQGRIGFSGMMMTPSGGFVGMSTNTPNSRFQSYWEQSDSPMPTQANDDLLRLRAARSAAGTEGSESADGPRQVSAVREPSLPYRTPFDRADETGGVVEAFPEGGTAGGGVGATSEPFRQPEQLWMRSGGEGRKAATGAAESSSSGARTVSGGGEADYGSRFIGGALPELPSTNTSAVSVPISMTPQNQLAQFQEYLELLLLRSPQVNPISPIQVTYSGGRATIRGIVPAESNKLAAGRILLSDSRVASVENLLTVLPADLNAPLPAAFDPNLSGTEAPASDNRTE